MSPTVRELTPRGAGGLAVLEVCGAGARELVHSLTPGAGVTPGRPCFVRLRIGEEDVDEAIVCDLGPERLELHVHGSVPLVERLREILERAPAEELTLSLEERARELLCAAPGEDAARILLDQAEGALRRDLEALAAAVSEEPFRDGVRALLDRGRRARFALRPATVVIAGPVNAGKSTLFNALVGRRRVVVDESAGTTRDAVRERVQLGGWPVELVDTAGERDVPGAGAAAAVERGGQSLARSARALADVVLWLVPPGGGDGDRTPPAAADGARVIEMESQGDRRPRAARESPRCLSARTDPGAARARVEAAFREALDLPHSAWEPGAGVPFAPDLLAGLEELLARADAPDRAARLLALTEGGKRP